MVEMYHCLGVINNIITNSQPTRNIAAKQMILTIFQLWPDKHVIKKCANSSLTCRVDADARPITGVVGHSYVLNTLIGGLHDEPYKALDLADDQRRQCHTMRGSHLIATFGFRQDYPCF